MVSYLLCAPQRVAYELAGKRLRSSDPFQFKAHLMLVISSRGVPIKRMSVEGQVSFCCCNLSQQCTSQTLMTLGWGLFGTPDSQVMAVNL